MREGENGNDTRHCLNVSVLMTSPTSKAGLFEIALTLMS